MNALQQSRAGSLERDRSANDLDGLLRAFFRAQVPEPWPAPNPPATLSVQGAGAAARRPSLFRSRFALAASLLILLIGQLFVASMFSGYAHIATDSNGGRLEATNRPASSLKKAKAIRQSDRILIPGRR